MKRPIGTMLLVRLPNIYAAANSPLAQKLAQDTGVGQVIVGGGANPAVRPELNPMLLNWQRRVLYFVAFVIINTNNVGR